MAAAVLLCLAWPASAQRARPAGPGRIRQALAQGRKALADQLQKQPERIDPALLAECITRLARTGPIDQASLAGPIGALLRADRPSPSFRSWRILALTGLGAKDHIQQIAADAAWLTRQQHSSGGWGFGPQHPARQANPNWTDTHRTALAVEALAAASQAGVRDLSESLTRAGQWLIQAANHDGGWGLQGPDGNSFRVMAASHGSTTAAAVAALACVDTALGPDAPEGLARALQRGAAWLDKNHDPAGHPGYVWSENPLATIEYRQRISLLAGQMGLNLAAKGDWTRPLIAAILEDRAEDGLFLPAEKPQADRLRATALSCQALWATQRPTALIWLTDQPVGATAPVRLARQLGREMALPLRIRQMQLDAADRNLSGARLVVADLRTVALPAEKDRPPAWLDELIEHVQADGTVVVLLPADADRAEAMSRQLTEKARPLQMQTRPVEASHPVLAMEPPIGPGLEIRATAVGNDIRSSIFLVSTDLAGAVESGQRGRGACRFILHALRYAGGPGGLGSGRDQPVEMPETVDSVQVARVRHLGGWGLCPDALSPMRLVLARAASLDVELLDPTDLDEPAQADLLWITGTKAPLLPARSMQQLQRYVAAGGTVFADATAGSEEFARALSQQLTAAFGQGQLKPIPIDHPLIRGTFAGGMGCDIRQVRYSAAAARKNPDLTQPVLQGIEVGGRLAIILSPYGVTGALEARTTYGAKTLTPEDARRLAANLLLYAWSSRSEDR